MEQCYYILIKIQVIKMKPLFVFSKYKKHIIFLTHKVVEKRGSIFGHDTISRTKHSDIIVAIVVAKHVATVVIKHIIANNHRK